MEKITEQREHLLRSQEARIYMNDCIEQCKQTPDRKVHISFDFAQQVILRQSIMDKWLHP